MRATGGPLIAVNATGCLEVFSTPFPETSWQIPWLHSLFGNAPAVASGVAAALKAKGRTDIRVVGQGGDGGTVDIGLACLSGMFERNDDVLYVCYDNQAYMNTGVQRSGATPPAARTATTQAVGPEPGNPFGQGKNVPLIAMAHEIPYVATATVADLRDLEDKADPRDGLPRRPLPARPGALPARLGQRPGRHDPVARLATESGLFPVFEAEARRGDACSTPIRRPVPVDRLPAPPGPLRAPVQPERATEVIARIQAGADRNIARFGLMPENFRERTGAVTTMRQAVRDHPRRRHQPGQPHRRLAHRAARLRRTPAAVQQRLPGG